MGKLAGKGALITGGATGLGLAIAERFLAEEAQVVITGRDRALGEQAERTLGPGARFIAADAADPDAVARSVTTAADHLGGLDVLVNNAGVGVTARLIETPLADYDRVMNINVRGYLLHAQHAYPHLARGRGCMIHIASDAGIWGEQATGLYSVTKAAVVMLGQNARTGRRPGRGALQCAVPGRHLARHAAHGTAWRSRPRRGRRRLAGAPDRPSREGQRRCGGGGVLCKCGGRVHHRHHAPGRRRDDRRLPAARTQRARAD